MTTIHETDLQLSTPPGEYRATCSCGWLGMWTVRQSFATADAKTHEITANHPGNRKNSIQEGIDEAADQGQTSDTQRNTR